jgi:hypothetical protein
MSFLKNVLYPFVKTNMIVYTQSETFRISQEEEIYIIPFEIENKNFCGQVIDYNSENKTIKIF